MIVPDTTEFPNNVQALIAIRIPQYVDQDLVPLKRPLRPADPVQCVGIFPSTKTPIETSMETGGPGEPTLKRYGLILQAMVKDTDEENAISAHSILAGRLWRMLYRDMPLRAGLTSLAVVADNSIERIQKRGITLQRYVSNEIQGSFIQTCWIEFWFETETVENG